MPQLVEAPEQFASGFTHDAVERISAEKREPAWMLERRLAAWRAYEATPLPTSAQRAWKYTDVSKLKLDAFVPYAREAEGTWASSTPPLRACAGLLMQSGSTAGDATLADDLRRAGVIFCSLDQAVRDHPDLIQAQFMTECVPASRDKFTALHGAFWSGGVFVYVPKNVSVSLPLYAQLWSGTAGVALFPHVLLIAEQGSEVTLVEEHGSSDDPAGILSCGVTEIFARDNARVRFVNLQRWGAAAQHFGMQRMLLDRDATLNFVTLGLGGRLAKATGESVMRGRGASSELLGLFYGRGRQQFDYVTLQDHQAPNTSSDLLFKSALNDRARSVYYGLVRVGPNAAQADANQENRNLLLSSQARADSDPVLEILTSEVTRCTHGASVGPVDEEQLFYMQARGIERSEAEKLLVSGFFHEVVGRIPNETIRQRLDDAIDERVLT
ncbi:MAG: Fe-S cluster assembly protein SufD [Dehalococcoidia bacterium]